MKILGISAFYHDSAAAIIEDGRVLFAAQEERFSRIKNDESFPKRAIQFCLEESNTTISEIDAIVFYDKPFLKFERILESYYAIAPKGIISFLRSMPIWIKEKLYIKNTLRKGLREIAGKKTTLGPIYFPEHHFSHAASAYYPSEFDDACILTIDGVGEYTTTSICHGRGNVIERLKTIHYPDSLGLLYASFTYYLGFRINSGEYKVMGLASYGNEGSEQFKDYYDIIKSKLIDIKKDGSFKMNQSYFRYQSELKMTANAKWEKLFGFKRRNKEEAIEEHHQNLAKAIQKITEEILTKLAIEGQRLTGSKNLCMAGGVALNCVANGVLLKESSFQNIYVQPAAGDAGGAIGAALSFFFLAKPNQKRKDTMPNMYVGPLPSLDLENTSSSLKTTVCKDFNALYEAAVAILMEGKSIGWVQGRMEFGPRALGNRSILADPRHEWMKDHVNKNIKNREGFRPFAPIVLEEDASDYFEMGDSLKSPFMLFTYLVKKNSIPAVTHVDQSSRVQTVSVENNEKLYHLLQKFKEKTGCPVLLNTSFNVKDEPMVCTSEDAFRCFEGTNIDYLIIDNVIFKK
jgi:carbamoyltransferase